MLNEHLLELDELPTAESLVRNLYASTLLEIMGDEETGIDFSRLPIQEVDNVAQSILESYTTAVKHAQVTAGFISSNDGDIDSIYDTLKPEDTLLQRIAHDSEIAEKLKHDFITPISTMKTSTYMAVKHHENENHEKSTEFLRKANNSLNILRERTRQYAEYQTMLDNGIYYLPEYMYKAIECLEKDNNIVYVLDTNTRTGDGENNVFNSLDELETIILNQEEKAMVAEAVRNARIHTFDDESTIEVVIGEFYECDPVTNEETLMRQIAVHNIGKGLSPEQIAIIHEPSTKGNDYGSTSGKSKIWETTNAGFGITFIKNFVEKTLGGRYFIVSEKTNILGDDTTPGYTSVSMTYQYDQDRATRLF